VSPIGRQPDKHEETVKGSLGLSFPLRWGIHSPGVEKRASGLPRGFVEGSILRIGSPFPH
jgi:hypothetical protein